MEWGAVTYAAAADAANEIIDLYQNGNPWEKAIVEAIIFTEIFDDTNRLNYEAVGAIVVMLLLGYFILKHGFLFGELHVCFRKLSIFIFECRTGGWCFIGL